MRRVAGRKERKFSVDTNLFMDAFRDEQAQSDLVVFHTAFAPFEYLSAIVIQELRAGTTTARDLRVLETKILEPFLRRGRVITPSQRAWELSGDVLRKLVKREGLQLAAVPKSFGNDILLALSCREAGATLVTGNTRDFRRIKAVVGFEFIEPWPEPAA